ncbi:Uncharacterized protein Rs2_04037 [Raphanus sativus]|nr:Uncharacterized protein Rs2_04037 [Raphanus sativus]
MGKCGKKSGEAAPAGVVKATKPLKKAKREPEDDDDLETKTNLKKQKKDVVIETMEGLADRLQRIESKLDMLVTKVDLLISAKGNKSLHVKKALKDKAEMSSSEDDESSSSDEDSKEKTVASVKVAAYKVSSSSSESDDEESDQGEKVEQRKANSGPMIGVVSDRGRWPIQTRFSGGRCGGLGRCGRC